MLTNHSKAINKLNNSKKIDYYRKDFFILKRKYNALKGKYNLEKKKAEGINMKLYYESHKNDDIINELKNKIKIFAEQIKSNVNTFDELKNEIDKKNNEIQQKNGIISRQNEIIKGLINEIKKKEINNINNNLVSFNSYNSNSLNNESVSQSININDVHYENEENEIDDNV